MATVTSADGTTIAYDKAGSGPPIILVASALSNRSDAARLAGLLAARFTVLNYDRRGRGASGDVQPYAVEREVEDIATLIEAAGGTASLFGSSSGAVLAMEAAARGLNVTRLALFEPPFVVDAESRRPPADAYAHVAKLLGEGRRSDAVRYFMAEVLGVPRTLVRAMRLMRKTWAAMTDMADTILYDLTILAGRQDGRPPTPDEWASVEAPALVLAGGKSDLTLRRSALAVADVLPEAEHRVLPGLNHGAVVMSPKALAPVLIEFFQSGATPEV
ncbi:MAG TPA: alpha/beta hydrolase [Jiangellaceae bacterium]